MSDTERVFPHQVLGDLRVEIQRPPARFGYAVHLLATTNAGDVTHTGHVDDKGEIYFTPYEVQVAPPIPFMHCDERVLPALTMALLRLPDKSTAPDPTHKHLDDALAIRDRLLTMVEKSVYYSDTPTQ